MENQNQDLDVVMAPLILAQAANVSGVPNIAETEKTLLTPEEPSSRPPVKKFLPRSWYKYSILGGAGLMLGALLVWVIGNTFFVHFKLGNTIISAHTTDSVLVKDVAAITQNYKLTIQYPNGIKKSFSLSDIGLQVNAPATVNRLRQEQQSITSRFYWWHVITVPVITKTNEAKLNSFIATHVIVIVRPAKDAILTVQGGTVQLADASAGKEYELGDASSNIIAAASALLPTPTKLKTLTLYPAITTDELVSSQATLKKALQQHIIFNIAGQTFSPSASDIDAWLELRPNAKNKTVDIMVNSSNVDAYINNITASYNRPPIDQVNAIADGTSSILVRGVDGVTVGDGQSVAITIAQNLLAGRGMQLALPISYTPYGTITTGDFPKWLEVDVTTKRLYAYQYGQLINTFLISAGKPSTPTPLGEFHIWEKVTSQTMVGPGYVQPNVPWINYFDHSGDAVHGNYWRPASVFGNVNTSHGCVGVQVDQAEWIYDWAPIGTPVIIHA